MGDLQPLSFFFGECKGFYANMRKAGVRAIEVADSRVVFPCL